MLEFNDGDKVYFEGTISKKDDVIYGYWVVTDNGAVCVPAMYLKKKEE